MLTRSVTRFSLTAVMLLLSSCVSRREIPVPISPLPVTAQCEVGAVQLASGEVNVKRVVKVNMVALNQAFWYNRLGASQLDGMIYALASDIAYTGSDQGGKRLLKKLQAGQSGDYSALVGKVSLRSDKRPRPIVLRANVNDCLDIQLTNLLVPTAKELTSHAGVHIEGMEMFSRVENNPDAIANDGALVGKNTSSLAAPGDRRQYSLFVPEEGAYMLYSSADNFSNFFEGQLTFGLFGALNVQPEGAEYYRSQVTRKDLQTATRGETPSGQPLIDYQATFRTGKPVLNMLQKQGKQTFELVYTDTTAIITGPNAGAFPRLPRQAVFNKVPQYPDRYQPYREFNIMYHEPVRAQQVFEQFDTSGSSPISNTLAAGGDFFAINYGMAGIGAEIWSNRIGVGPMHDCVTCAYEEFFLSSWAVGDPAMVVDIPANFCAGSSAIDSPTDVPTPNPPACEPQPGPKATKAFYPDDPSNVYHSYMSDHVKMRVHHGAGTLHHLHHLHAHQWLHSPKNDNSHYLDSQLIGPGSSFTLDMVYNGSGNRNQTVGDSIFHCHFYPHFAEGMWSLWRVHDVFEGGTVLTTDGVPAPGSRALPDGEIAAGTPIPAVVPVPTVAMAPLPSDVFIDNGQVVFGTLSHPDPTGAAVISNPGYPFFVPGIAGERPPHPPLDFASLKGEDLDGGLPRHVVYPAKAKGNGYDPQIVEYHNRFDFSKFHSVLEGKVLPEQGTSVERVAMQTHSTRTHRSSTPEGKPAQFILNGLPARKGAPYADPCGTKSSSQHLASPEPVPEALTRHYRGVDMQMDVVLNKKGWHYSQQRFGVLWQDLIPTLNRERPAEPLFFRANSGDCVEYWMANVVPEYYELDDFQVRTPTDVLGQHIHLVKFDVTSSDGGANGWNYEDGTFAPNTVVDRLHGFKSGKLEGYSGDFNAVAPVWLCENLSAAEKEDCLKRANTEWLGAQATVQRWYADPQLNNMGKDRTVRTVFTHDHFSPSTHQQAGLYMGLLVEPEGSQWRGSETGVAFYSRPDGGPTSWQAIVETPALADSYREFMLEFQDFQLAYTEDSWRPTQCVKGSDGTLPPMCYPEQNKVKNYGNETAINELCLKSIGSKNSVPPPQCTTPLTPGAYVTELRDFTNGYSGYIDPTRVINPPQLQGGQVTTPTLISTTPPFALGTYSINYRSEPLPFRVWDPQDNTQAGGVAGDLAHVYRSIERVDPQLNSQNPKGGSRIALTAGVYPSDPYTPLMRAYQGDNVQVRTLVGAHVNMHNFSIQGARWLFEPSNTRSGYRSNQPMGISEHFEMRFDVPPSTVSGASLRASGKPTSLPGCSYRARREVTFADYLYNPSSEENGLLNGNWGLLRAYQQGRQGLCLQPLPNNNKKTVVATRTDYSCPAGAPQREYDVVAVSAAQLPDKKVIYSSENRERIYDEQALLYFGCDKAADAACSHKKLLQDLPWQSPQEHIEPFVLRAAAGECITVNLANTFNVKKDGSFPGDQAINNPNEQNALLQFRYSASEPDGNNCIEVVSGQWFCDMKIAPSKEVALAPQLVSYDINRSNGVNLGFNSVQTVALGKTATYRWYAGITSVDAEGKTRYRPAEFGTANLLTADPLEQSRFGMLAGMVIEPEGACWSSQDGTATTCKQDGQRGVIAGATNNRSSTTDTQVTVYYNGGEDYFQEFVVMAQDSLAAAMFTNPINYGVERMAGKDTGLPGDEGRGRFRNTVATGDNIGNDDYQLDVSCGYSNSLGKPYPNQPEDTPLGEPETPIFRANPGDPVRFRVMQPHGADQHTFELFGHVWQEEPYNPGSTVIANNPDSQWQGSRMGLSAADRFDVVIDSAGGRFATPGDYLYRSFPGGDQSYGMWGIFRVGDADSAYAGGGIIRPLVCVPQWKDDDLQYVYSDELFDGYELPSGCSLVGTSMVKCSAPRQRVVSKRYAK